MFLLQTASTGSEGKQRRRVILLWSRLAVVTLAGALGAALANRGIAVFHDGLRPMVPERTQGHIERREFVSQAFSLSYGLLLGFGIPFSIVSGVLLNHALWLGTDAIGTWFPGQFEENGHSHLTSALGLVGAIFSGAVYGGLLLLGIDGIGWLTEHLPVGIFDSFGYLARVIVLTFAAFPAVAVAYQHGIRRGFVAFLSTLVAWLAASVLGSENPSLWALATGMVVLVIYALGGCREQAASGGFAAYPSARVRRVRSSLPVLAATGAVYGLACNQGIMAEGAQSLVALAIGDKASATGFAFVRALSFVPLKTMSALTTGVFAVDGLGFVAPVGVASPNPIVASAGGAVVIVLEVLSLRRIAGFLERHPGALRTVDSIRTGMTKVLEVASLVGGALAANSMAPGLGFFIGVAVYLLNEVGSRPIPRVAIGPVALIAVWIVANVLALSSALSLA
jgi:hypothetical protein